MADLASKITNWCAEALSGSRPLADGGLPSVVDLHQLEAMVSSQSKVVEDRFCGDVGEVLVPAAPSERLDAAGSGLAGLSRQRRPFREQWSGGSVRCPQACQQAGLPGGQDDLFEVGRHRDLTAGVDAHRDRRTVEPRGGDETTSVEEHGVCTQDIAR